MDALRSHPRKAVLLAVGAGLLAAAYRPLLTFAPRFGGLEAGVEGFLITPSDQAPGIVVALAGWLAYRRWPRLRAIPPRRAAWAWIAPAAAFGAVSALWAVFVGADDLLALSLIANLSALVMLQWGLPGLRVMWLPLVFLIFCIPLPAPLLVSLLWKLRLWTADYAGWLLYTLGATAFVSGDQIVRATQTFQVIEGCSGLRSMETLTMLVVLLIDLFRRRGWHAAILLLAAPPVAFAMNGLRVLTLILNPHSEIVAIHSIQGIGILLLGLLTIYFLDVAIDVLVRGRRGPHDPQAPVSDRAERARSRAAGPAAGLPGLLLMAPVVLAISVFGPVYQGPVPSSPDFDAILADALDPGLRWKDVDEDGYFLGRVRFRTSLHRSYRQGATHFDVFLGSGDRRDRRTSVLSPITLVPGSGWLVRESHPRVVDGRVVLESVIEKGVVRLLSWHWEENRDGLAHEALVSFLGLDRSPFWDPQPAIVARVSTPVAPDDADRVEWSRERLARLYDLLTPYLRGWRAEALPR